MTGDGNLVTLPADDPALFAKVVAGLHRAGLAFAAEAVGPALVITLH